MELIFPALEAHHAKPATIPADTVAQKEKTIFSSWAVQQLLQTFTPEEKEEVRENAGSYIRALETITLIRKRKT